MERDNLIRAVFPGGEYREADDGRTLSGHFARFNEWTRIDSVFEGTFMERIAPGAFARSFAEHKPKVLFQHGKDPELGDKPIGAIRSLAEDDDGAAYEAGLFDGLPPLVMAGLRAGEYGASFKFSVRAEDVNRKPAKSEYNPDGIPERTITDARVYEFGPVTFPAYAGATASVRSLTDEFRTPVTVTMTVPAVTLPKPQENPPVTEYVSREDKAARVIELESSITSRASAYPGVFPDDVQAADDAENKEHDALVRDIAAWDARQARVEAFGKDPAKAIPAVAPAVVRTRPIEDIYKADQFSGVGFRNVEERNSALRDNAMRSLEASRIQNDQLAKLLDNDQLNKRGLPSLAERVLKTGSPAYRRAFGKYILSGNDFGLTTEERAAVAVVGTTTTGGYAVPYIFDPSVVRLGAWTAQNPFRAACDVTTITTGNNWKGVTVGAITAAYAAEAAAASENGPTWGTLDYTVRRAQAFVTLSIEALEDRSDFTDELTAVFGEAKDTLEENKFAVGSGTPPDPLGMFTDTAYTNQDTATNDVTAIADILVLEGALPLRFRARGAFFMNRSTLRQLLALDTTYRYFSGAGLQFAGQNQPNYNQGGNTGFSLLGYPVWEVPSAVSTLTTDGAIIVVFCDPKSYKIVDRIGMNVEVIPNMLNGATPSFPTGQRGVYAYWRNTAKPTAADAGRSLSVQ